MFDISFGEVLVVAVVALIVVGPEEFPSLVRNTASWIGKARQFISSVRTDFEYEIEKAEELKRLIAKEAEVAELHKVLEEQRKAINAMPAQFSAPATAKIDESTKPPVPVETAPQNSSGPLDKPKE